MAPSRKKDFPGITEAELSVLKLLWEEGDATPHDLQTRLSDDGTEWAYTTVQTLLHRLLRKGFVARRREGVNRVYRPTVDRDELLARHMGDLADRLCEGSATPLLLSLAKTKKFSRKELDRFRAILDENRGSGRKRKGGG